MGKFNTFTEIWCIMGIFLPNISTGTCSRSLNDLPHLIYFTINVLLSKIVKK